MIEKLKLIDKNGHMVSDFELKNKINEIIDHLPQEKEPLCECGCGLPKQPTKEVPEPVIERVLWEIYNLGIRNGKSGYKENEVVRKDIDQALQEISALYKRGDK